MRRRLRLFADSGGGLLRRAAARVFFIALGAGCSGEHAGSWFQDFSQRLGLPPAPGEWPEGRYRLPEITSAGLAFFDADGDGDLDLYLACHPPPGRLGEPAPNRLFLLEDGGRFREAPGAGGLADPGYGNGVALGDIDGDGDLDVYVANVGPDALFLNEGGGRFRDITREAGISGDAWSSGAAFFDYDLDGRLDLFVVHYVVDDPSRVCRPRAGAPQDYCGPERYQSVPDTLYRNEGGLRFRDVSAQAGIVIPRAGLSAVSLDFTGDGLPDVYVANDRQPNLLYVNRGDGTFRDEAFERGVAVNGAGQPEASMGIAPGDADGDGDLDLFLTHLGGETSTLYLQEAPGRFRDRSARTGLGAPTLPYTGWGTAFLDCELDGDLDLLCANGRVARGEPAADSIPGGFWASYAEPGQLFVNEGGRFRERKDLAGDFGSVPRLLRTLALGDYDGDGDLDFAASGLANDLWLFRNDAPRRGRYLAVRARTGKRDALGALVYVHAAGRTHLRPVLASESYGCAREPMAHFGLGPVEKIDFVEIVWPGGARERFGAPEPDRSVVFTQSTGRAAN